MENKKDNLKDFIQQNKDAFDDEVPANDLWGKIEQNLPKKEIKANKKVSFFSYKWNVAASIVCIMTVGVLGYFVGQNNTKDNAIAKTEKVNEAQYPLSQVSTEIAEVEKYYITQINAKIKESKTLKINPENFSELEILKSEFEELKKEMNNNIDKELIIEAMIDNYKLRLSILNDILGEIKNQKENNVSKNNL